MPAVVSASQQEKPIPNRPSAVTWTGDMTVLACFTATLWIITLGWQATDLDQLAAHSIRSESDAWIFALTLAPLYLVLTGIAATWGVILGIPTSLLAGHLALRRLERRRRWLIVGIATALLFIGAPIALNRHEEGRLADRYGQSDAAPFPAIAGRAIELPGETVIHPPDPIRARCTDECLELLTFGRATSVTLSFPASEGAPASPLATYRLGPVGPDCAGTTLRDVCPHLTPASIPPDRVILTTGPVDLKSSDAAIVLARRLYARDMRRPDAPPARLTRFTFAHYPSLLNLRWRGHSFHLPREHLPILGYDALNTRLYRDIAGNVFEGQSYPFR